MNIFSRTEPQVVRHSSPVLQSSAAASCLRIARAALLPLAFFCASAAFAQLPSFATPASTQSSLAIASTTESTSAPLASTSLPEDPSASMIAAAPSPQLAPENASKAGPVASKYAMTIASGEKALPWTAHDKFVGGLRDLYSPISLLGDILSASYSHVTNGQPNYGTNLTAYGKRVGATFARDTSESFFAESIMAPVLHEDPRYYVEGSRYNVFHRTLYAITRPLITRTDSGRTTINGAVLIGYAGGSALSYTYYPEINRNFKDTAATYGGSLAGAAIGDFVAEFIGDVFHRAK